MLRKLRRNMAIVMFCTNDLKENHQFSGRAALLLSNFSFLLKSSLMQIILVALCRFPSTALVILMILEGVYIALHITQYARYQHLKSFFLLLPKII